MLDRLERRRVFPWLGLAGLYLALVEVIDLHFGHRVLPAIYLLAALAFVPAIWLTMERSAEAMGAMPRRWRIWSVALAAEMAELFSAGISSLHLPGVHSLNGLPPLFAVLAFTVYLFLVTTPAARDGLRLPALIDLVLAAGICVFFYLAFLLPDSTFSATERTMFLTLLRLIALVGALLALRSARNAEEYELMRLVSLFLAVDLTVIFILNQVVLGLFRHTGPSAFDVLMCVPPLTIALVLLFARSPAFTSNAGRSRHAVQSGMSFFLTLTLLGMGVWLMPRDYFAGTLAIVGATVAFGIRTVAAHNYILESEDKLRTSLEHFRGLADHDPLTSVWNRRAFDTALRNLLDPSRRGDPVALVLLDIDYFKEWNDKLGHLFGDRCLQGVASALGRATRLEGDLVCRLGGDEFGVILPGTALAGACTVAERIRREIQTLKLDGPQGRRLTVSVGIAASKGMPPATVDELVGRADEQLYAAKRMGRDRVEWQHEAFAVIDARAG